MEESSFDCPPANPLDTAYGGLWEAMLRIKDRVSNEMYSEIILREHKHRYDNGKWSGPFSIFQDMVQRLGRPLLSTIKSSGLSLAATSPQKKDKQCFIVLETRQGFMSRVRYPLTDNLLLKVDYNFGDGRAWIVSYFVNTKIHSIRCIINEEINRFYDKYGTRKSKMKQIFALERD